MRINRTLERVVAALVVTGGIALAVLGVVVLADAFFPNLAVSTALGLDTLTMTIASQLALLASLTGLSPVTDLLLFGAAYILVCVFLWFQSELRIYLANRSHFR